MEHRTLCFLLRAEPHRQILLGLKKAGFGSGKYAGFGGRVEPGEEIVTAAARELEEETCVQVAKTDLYEVGRLTFLFPARTAWNQEVFVFTAASWNGDPRETTEMRPQWFAPDEIPFDRMWQDAIHWLPRILDGERLSGRFTFGVDCETVVEQLVQSWEGSG